MCLPCLAPRVGQEAIRTHQAPLPLLGPRLPRSVVKPGHQAQANGRSSAAEGNPPAAGRAPGEASGRRSVHLLDEVDIGRLSDASPLHRPGQFFGEDELPRLLQALPLQKDQDLRRVMDAAEDIAALGTVSLPRTPMFVKDRLPRGEVSDSVSDEDVRHGKHLPGHASRLSAPDWTAPRPAGQGELPARGAGRSRGCHRSIGNASSRTAWPAVFCRYRSGAGGRRSERSAFGHRLGSQGPWRTPTDSGVPGNHGAGKNR